MATRKPTKSKKSRKTKVSAPLPRPELPLGLQMRQGWMHQGNSAFENATNAVFAHPDRLVYVEGFITHSDCSCCVPIHHAWVLDKLTGLRHELTIEELRYDTYIGGKEFTKDELRDLSGEPVEAADGWESQLSLQDQYTILRKAGYDVELVEKRYLDYGDEEVVVDMTSIDMADRYTPFNPDVLDVEEWHYIWRFKQARRSNDRANKGATGAAG